MRSMALPLVSLPEGPCVKMNKDDSKKNAKIVRMLLLDTREAQNGAVKKRAVKARQFARLQVFARDGTVAHSSPVLA